jgi:hypothetical protein
LSNDFDLRGRKIRVGIHGHALKRNDAADGDEPGQHQHEKSLPQCRLDDSMDHSIIPLLERFPS